MLANACARTCLTLPADAHIRSASTLRSSQVSLLRTLSILARRILAVAYASLLHVVLINASYSLHNHAQLNVCFPRSREEFEVVLEVRSIWPPHGGFEMRP